MFGILGNINEFDWYSVEFRLNEICSQDCPMNCFFIDLYSESYSMNGFSLKYEAHFQSMKYPTQFDLNAIFSKKKIKTIFIEWENKIAMVSYLKISIGLNHTL